MAQRTLYIAIECQEVALLFSSSSNLICLTAKEYISFDNPFGTMAGI